MIANPDTSHSSPSSAVRPYAGIAGVLLGSIISTLCARITTFGLADIGGAVHAGFDEGAWISTSFTVAQMLVAFPSVWLAAAVGPRRVLLCTGAIFTLASLALPFSKNISDVLLLQAVAGMSSGAFIPVTIGFVLRSLPQALVPYGIAVYAMNSELSQNVAASMEGWFVDRWSWSWIFWDNALLTPIMMFCVWIGIPREPLKNELLMNSDWSGLLFPSLGLAAIYAALDQGNRLDWLNSGLVNGLLMCGSVLLVAFVVQEIVEESPVIDLRAMISGNIPLLMLVLILFRLIVLSTAFLIPQFLTTVHNFRALDVGQVLLWIALPQLLLAPLVGRLLTRTDARVPLGFGFFLIGCACFMASGLTGDWMTSDFLPSQIVQAVGQSLAFTSVVYLASQHIRPANALSLGALIQTARLFGGELGNAFMQTFVENREQLHSNLTGLHVAIGALTTDDRLRLYYSVVASESSDVGTSLARARSVLAQAVRQQAEVLSYIDGFAVLGIASFVGLLMIALLHESPRGDP